MLSMTQINLIRTLYYGQGKTISEISRETGFDRKTICQRRNFFDPKSRSELTHHRRSLCKRQIISTLTKQLPTNIGSCGLL